MAIWILGVYGAACGLVWLFNYAAAQVTAGTGSPRRSTCDE